MASSKSCQCTCECKPKVLLNHSSEISIGQLIGVFDQPYLGWWYVDPVTVEWKPAVDLKIKQGARVYVFVVSETSRLTNISYTVLDTGQYDHVLGIRYDTLQNAKDSSVPFVACLLDQLLKLCCVQIDLFGHGEGGHIVRWILEVLDYGANKKFQNITLVGYPPEGVLNPCAKFVGDGALAAKVALGIYATITNTILKSTPLKVYKRLVLQFAGNAEFDSCKKGTSKFIAELNRHKVSCEARQTIKYYILNGYDPNFLSVAELNLFLQYPVGSNPYVIIARDMFCITDPNDEALILSWQTQYPNLGQFISFALSMLDSNVVPIINDGYVPSTFQPLIDKSCFFAENQATSVRLIDKNNTVLAGSGSVDPADPLIITVYRRLLQTFTYSCIKECKA